MMMLSLSLHENWIIQSTTYNDQRGPTKVFLRTAQVPKGPLKYLAFNEVNSYCCDCDSGELLA